MLDGNYYVWIPRFSYKIYDKEGEEGYKQYTSPGGGNSYRIDVKFLSGTSSEVEDGYIVHPAFNFGGKELEGIWVGKYETSGTEQKPTILPNETSLRNINVSTMFNTAKKLCTENIDAHMLKNIEWGAVAYLTQSQYGRNGTEISVNQCSKYITGVGRGIGDGVISNSTYEVPTEEQQYNGKIGKLSSTTGNVYGIYDMSGGAYEYVMGFYATEENIPVLESTGFTEDTFPKDNKYYDLYKNPTNKATDYTSGKKGDSTIETHGWNNDVSNFVQADMQVFLRGGLCTQDTCGIFYFGRNTGDTTLQRGFRVCLAI